MWSLPRISMHMQASLTGNKGENESAKEVQAAQQLMQMRSKTVTKRNAKKKTKTTKKQTPQHGASSSRTPILLAPPTALLSGVDPLPWLDGVPLPPNWALFADRDVVAERRFDLEDILQNSELGKIQLASAPQFLFAKHITPYLSPLAEQYSSLTKLFYAGFYINKYNEFEITIGTFNCTINQEDIENLFDNDHEFIKLVGPSIAHTIPLPILVKEFFLGHLKVRHDLKSHIDIFLHMVMHSNILPSKGNKNELTERMIGLLHYIHHGRPFLARTIFHRMKNVISEKKKVVLSFPGLITALLRQKGFVFPDVHEKPMTVDVIGKHYWDRAMDAGTPRRVDAFLRLQKPLTVGMVWEGTPLDENEPVRLSRKRLHTDLASSSARSQMLRPPHPPTSGTPIFVEYPTPTPTPNDVLVRMLQDMSLQVVGRLDRMHGRMDDMHTGLETRIDSLQTRIDSLQTEVHTGFEDMRVRHDKLASRMDLMLVTYAEEDDVPEHEDDDDEFEEEHLFDKDELVGTQDRSIVALGGL